LQDANADWSETDGFWSLLTLADDLELLPQPAAIDVVAQASALLVQGSPAHSASARAEAARHLAVCAHASRLDVGVLHAALLDDDDRVRLWAHCALGVFLGRPARHRQAIQEITAAAHGRRRREVLEDAEAALELLAASPGQRDLRVLDFGCFHNDVGLLQRVIQRVGLPALNSGPMPALAIAAVDRNRQAVRFLLEHGADPNVRVLLGKTVLQDAARRRRTASIIRDLLEYGADPAARDAEGQTALALAEKSGLWENARVLREFSGQ
jgi:hypothetical protein